MSNLVFAGILPHPPILVPEIGKSELSKAEKSIKALEEIAKRLKEINPDTIVVITPHGEVGNASVPVYTSHVFEGNFAHFGYPKLKFSFKGDATLALSIVKEARDYSVSISETVLDHGILVPLYYPYIAGIKKPIVPIAVAMTSLSRLYEFGKKLGAAIEKSGKKVAIIGSADMSHRLTVGAPSGYSPKGAEFDNLLVKLVGDYNVRGIIDFPVDLAEAAGQDALWSIAMVLGALDGKDVKAEVLSYEGPFGVGYMIAEFKL